MRRSGCCLISDQRPAVEPACAYWRACALHRRKVDDAARDLEIVSAGPGATGSSPERQAILFGLADGPDAGSGNEAAHQRNDAGPPLPQAGSDRRRRTPAAAWAEDADAWDVERLLYSRLGEADYVAAVGTGKVLSESITPTSSSSAWP